MTAASINDIKKEISSRDIGDLRRLILRVAKYKKENKELLNYLLFEADHENNYVNAVKEDINELFREIPSHNAYFMKKSLRKIIRFMNRQVKYSGVKQTELELRLYFCELMRSHKLPMHHGTMIQKIYQQQFSKVTSIFTKLPEDLQADFQREVQRGNI